MSRRLVITVHGIRTFGQWQERLARLLREADPEITVENYHYGYFSVLAFLVPFFRWWATRQFRAALLRIAASHPERQISIVAHSFGTHLLAWGLRGTPQKDRPQLDTIILAGSVLRSDFPWGELLDTGSVRRVVNDCGTSDQILILSQVGVLLTGMAGRMGFTGMTGERLVNRFFKGGHSDYFQKGARPDDEFMRRYWVPVLARSEAPLAVDEREARGPLQGVGLTLLQLADPLKFLAYFTLALAAFYFGYQEPRNREALAREREAQAAEKARVEALGRRGRTAIGLLESGGAVESALALLGQVVAADRSDAYPDFRQILASWLPRLTGLDDLLAAIPPGTVFGWRGRSYLKLEDRILQVPARVEYHARSKAGDLLFTLDIQNVFHAFRIPPPPERSLQPIASVRLGTPPRPENDAEEDETQEDAAADSDQRFLLTPPDPILEVEFYHFPEAQVVLLSGIRQSHTLFWAEYREILIDLAGRGKDVRETTRLDDPDCDLYWRIPDEDKDFWEWAKSPRLRALARELEGKRGSVAKHSWLSRYALEAICGKYLVGKPHPDMGRWRDAANAAAELRFPVQQDERRLWAVAGASGPLPKPAFQQTRLGPVVEVAPPSSGDPRTLALQRDLRTRDMTPEERRVIGDLGFARFYLLDLPDGGYYLFINHWGQVESFEACVASAGTRAFRCSGLLDGNYLRFLVSPDARYVAVKRIRGNLPSGYVATPVELVALGGGSGPRMQELPDRVDGMGFNADSSRLVLVGDDQAWVYELPAGRLLSRISLGATARAGRETPAGDRFDRRVPIAVAGDLAVTVHGNGALVAIDLSDGVPRWITGYTGVSSIEDGNLLVSADGKAIAVHNRSGLRLISTASGAFLSPLVDIASLVAGGGKRTPSRSGTLSVTFSGPLTVRAGGTSFILKGPMDPQKLESNLPRLQMFTGVDVADGVRPLAALPGTQ